MSYAILRLAKAHRAVAAVLLREIGLYPGQELLLMRLCDRNGQSQAELVRAMDLDASTVARAVSRLEEQGIVWRQASPTDRRAVVVTLTARGARLCGDVRRVWSELEDVTTEGMSDRDRRSLLRVLHRVADRLAARED